MNSGIVIWYNWCRKPIGHQLGFQGCSPTVKRSQNNRVHDFSVFLADHKNNHPTSSVSSPLWRLWSEGKWKKHEKHRCFRKKINKNLKLPTSISYHIFQPARYIQISHTTKVQMPQSWCLVCMCSSRSSRAMALRSYCWVKTMGFSWGFTDLLLGLPGLPHENHMKIQGIQIHHRVVSVHFRRKWQHSRCSYPEAARFGAFWIMIPAKMMDLNHQGVHQQEWFHHVWVKNLQSSPRS